MVTYWARRNKGRRTEGDDKMFRVFYVPQRKIRFAFRTGFLDVSPLDELAELFLGLFGRPVTKVEGLPRLRESKAGQSGIETDRTSHTRILGFTFEPR